MLSDQSLKEMGFTSSLIENAKVIARQEKKNLLQVILALDRKTKEIVNNTPQNQKQVLYNQAVGQIGTSQNQLRSEGLPVGLKNVSNCCYLNSLLQSYFFCAPLFKKVINFKKPDSISQQFSLAKRKRIQASYGLVLELKKLFVKMAYSNLKKIDPTPLLNFLVNQQGIKVTMGEQRDISQFNMLLLDRLQDAFSTNQGGRSIIRQIYFIQKVQQLNGQLQEQYQSLGYILSGQAGSLMKGLKDQLCYTVQMQGKQQIKQTWIKHFPKLLYIHINRVDFQGKSAKKINTSFSFDKELTLDQFLLQNREKSKKIRKAWVQAFAIYQKQKQQFAIVQKYLQLHKQLNQLHNKLPIYVGQLQSIKELEQWYQKSKKSLINQKVYLDSLQRLDGKYIYQLMAIFIHHGKANFGHYWVNIRQGDNWYKISDSQVAKIQQQQAIKQGEGQDETSAYSLIYRRKNDIQLNEGQVDLSLSKQKQGNLLQQYQKYYSDWISKQQKDKLKQFNQKLQILQQRKYIFNQALRAVDDYQARFQFVNQKCRIVSNLKFKNAYYQNLAIFLRSKVKSPSPLLKYHLFDVICRNQFKQAASQLQNQDPQLYNKLTKIMKEKLNRFLIPQFFQLKQNVRKQYHSVVRQYAQGLRAQKAILVLFDQTKKLNIRLTTGLIGSRSQTNYRKMINDVRKVLILQSACLWINKYKQKKIFDKQNIQQLFTILASSLFFDSQIKQQILDMFNDLSLESLDQKFKNPLKEIIYKTDKSKQTQDLLKLIHQEAQQEVKLLLTTNTEMQKRGKLWKIQNQWDDPAQQLRSFTRKKQLYVQFYKQIVASKKIINRQQRVFMGFHL